MAKKETIKKQPSKRKNFKIASGIVALISFITLITIYFLGVMPMHYFIMLTIFFLLLDFLVFYFLLGKGWKKRLFGTIFSFFFVFLNGIILWYSFNTLDFFNKINGQDYNTENYSILVLKNSDLEKLKQLKEKDIGIFNEEDDKGLEKAKKELNKKVKVAFKEEEDLEHLYQDFIDEEIEAILVEDAEKKMLEEEYEKFNTIYRVLDTFSVDVEMKDKLVKEVDISKKSFNLFISGIDSYGKITSVSRSDVNMVVSVNPNTHQILFTSIPRDYYVKLHGINTTYKDKLTHAGIHGIDMSVKTVEDLLETDINYYAKVNFTSLIDIVDELGGIDVYLDEAFHAYYVEDEVVDYYFKKGNNHLNGKQALAFCRERKSLASGDVARTYHQQLVLEGILNKVLSKNIITKYTNLLNSLEGKFVTNIGTKNITKLVKEQIKEGKGWSIDKNTLTGTGAYDYTYAYKKTKAYVMVPDEDSLNEAKDKIKTILEG